MYIMNSKNSNKTTTSYLRLLPRGFTPGPHDILCGRGNVYANHDANQRFNRAVRANIQDYSAAPNRYAKIGIVVGILEELHSKGFRILKIDSVTDQWYILKDVEAHQKIGHALRDMIRSLKSKPTAAAAWKRKRQQQQQQLQQHQRPHQPQQQPQESPRSCTPPPPTSTKKPQRNPSFHRTFDKILQMGIDTADFLKIDWERPAATPSSSSNKTTNKTTTLRRFNSSNSTGLGSVALLEDEYPEESFEFSASGFFGDRRIAVIQ